MSDGNCIIPMQQKLYDLYDSGQIRRPVGSYGALTSSANQTANPVQVALIDKAGKNGKKAKYQITYVDPTCSPVLECDDEDAGICATGTSEDVQTTVKTIDGCAVLPVIEITTDQFRDLCNFGPDAWLTAQLVGRLDTGMQYINEKIATVLCANSGSYADNTTTVRDLPLINTVTNTPAFGALRKVTQEYRKVGMPLNPIFIGSDALDMYGYGMQYGGQTQGGSNFREPQFPMFYDDQLGGVCDVPNRETVLALAPGVAQFVNFLDNAGDFQTNFGGDMNLLRLYQNNVNYTKGVFEDPITGYLWDMSVVYDTCNDVWKIRLKSKFDTWVLPIQQCKAAGWTGITKWGACELQQALCGPTES